MENNLENNKQFIKDHFEEFVNKRNSAVVYQNMTEDFLDHDELGGPTRGPEPAKQMMERMYASFKDLHVSIEDIVAEGDKVMVRNIWSATGHDGKQIQFRGFVLWRIENNKIAERWATVTGFEPQKEGRPNW